jgi:hypothetical protein
MAIGVPSADGLANNIGLFIRTMFWGGSVVGALGFAWYMKTFNYEVEINQKSGTGILIIRKRARKLTKKGITVLDMGRGNLIKFPDNPECIYKKGKTNVVRFYKPDEKNYFPMTVSITEPTTLKMIPQEVDFFYVDQLDEIEKKYRSQKEFLEKYGAIIGVGLLIIGFIMAIYFMQENISKAIDLGGRLIDESAKVRAGQVIT